MLTAITTAAGVTPLLLGTTIGAQFLKPTAVSVFYKRDIDGRHRFHFHYEL